MGNSFSIAFIGIAHYADGHHCDGDNDHKEEDEEDNVEYVRGAGGISSRGSHVWGKLKDVLWKTLMGYNNGHSCCYKLSGFCLSQPGHI